MMVRGAKGDQVKELQRALIALDYDLPRWGVDGDLGTETLEALGRFLRDHGTAADDDANTVSDAELDLVRKIYSATQEAPLGPKLSSGRFHDIRSTAAQNNVGSRRSWTQITGIVLHQTACCLGEKPARWGTVGAHLGVTRAGQVIWMHDFERIVWHANTFNNFTVGIEMDGEYAGVEGDDHTFWRPHDDPHRQPQHPTPELVDAAMATVRWICDEVTRHGGKVTRLLAHRQASGDRQSDPGSGLWKGVAMPLHTELGLTDGGIDYKVGTGYQIPETWDPTRKGIRY